jgi:hypothetical protein
MKVRDYKHQIKAKHADKSSDKNRNKSQKNSFEQNNRKNPF